MAARSFKKTANPFRRLTALDGGHAQLKLILDGLLKGEFPLLICRPTVTQKTALGEAQELFGQGLCLSPRGARRHDPVGQSHAQRLFGPNRPTRKNHIQGMGETYGTGQSNRAAIYQGHTPTPAKYAEYGIPFHHAQVAPEGKLESTGHCMTSHRGDDWFAQIHTAGTHGAITFFF
jgi:hypothetical protein